MEKPTRHTHTLKACADMMRVWGKEESARLWEAHPEMRPLIAASLAAELGGERHMCAFISAVAGLASEDVI